MSCASDVFPAVRLCVIRTDAFVGWTGNERQFEVLDACKGVSLSEEPSGYSPHGCSRRSRPPLSRTWGRSPSLTRQAEADFYGSLGLSDAFVVCAVGDALGRRPGFAGQRGWGLSLADMARPGPASSTRPTSAKAAMHKTPRVSGSICCYWAPTIAWRC